MYYLEGQDYLDLDIHENQSPLGKQLVEKLQNQIKDGEKINQLDNEDVQFLKMLIDDYELRYFINKTENQKEILQGHLMLEQFILQQLRASQAKNKKPLQLKREDLNAFEIFPDFYMGYYSSINRSSNSIVLDLPSQIQAQLLKQCSDPKLRSQIFYDFLETNKSNESLLNQLMEVRLQFANQLGFEDYQHYQLALNSKFFHFARNTFQKQMLNSLNQHQQQGGFKTKDTNNMSSDRINQTRDIKIIIQRILNASVERCHKRLESLLSDPQFYKNLQEKAKIRSGSEQKQLQYQDYLYLRQNILGTPSNKFTLTWQQAFTLLNQVSQKFLNVEFKECQAPKNNFFYRVCDINKEELSNGKEVHESDTFKYSNNDNEFQQKANQVEEKNIKCFEILLKEKNGSQKLKGVVFIDFNAYEDAKTCFSSGYCEINKYVQLPCLLVRMNFKVLDSKTEMTFDNFQTFMHEIGHSLHSVLNHHRYQLYANNFKIDYAEICAKVFENLVFLLPQNSSKSNGASKELQQKQDSAAEFVFQKPFQQYIEIFRIVSQLEQIYQAKLDLFLHEKHPEDSTTLKEFSSLIQKNIFKNLIPNNDNYWFCNLSHLEEYSGLYFSYAVGEEVFNELQDRKESLQEQQQFIQNLFTSAHQ